MVLLVAAKVLTKRTTQRKGKILSRLLNEHMPTEKSIGVFTHFVESKLSFFHVSGMSFIQTILILMNISLIGTDL